MESMPPLFTAAVVLGHVTGLKSEDIIKFTAWFLALKVVYMAV